MTVKEKNTAISQTQNNFQQIRKL